MFFIKTKSWAWAKNSYNSINNYLNTKENYTKYISPHLSKHLPDSFHKCIH
jgi:hypothetical protein